MGIHTDPPNLGSAQKSENLSTLGLQYTVKKNTRNFLLGTIQEPKVRAFRNTHYFIQSDNSSTLSICPKFGNFQKNSTKKCTVNWLNFLKISKLWTLNKCARIIALNQVMGVSKSSDLWLLNGNKQKIPSVLFDCVLKA